METKEELKRKFLKVYFEAINSEDSALLFDFFWREILQRDNVNTIREGALKYQREENENLNAKISRLESTLEAAETTIKDQKEKIKALITQIEYGS